MHAPFFSRSCLTIFIYQLDLLFKNVVRLPQTLKIKNAREYCFVPICTLSQANLYTARVNYLTGITRFV